MMKYQLVVILSIASLLFSCSTGSKNKAEKSSDTIDCIPAENENGFSQKPSKVLDVVKDSIDKLKTSQKESPKTPIKIDTLKIYEESEVTRAFPSLSNSENLKFFVKEYNSSVVKEGVRGRVIYDFVVERDGSISDVLIVEGLHTDVDNELIRVMKMLPPFSVPGKIDGVPVRSKFRATMSIR